MNKPENQDDALRKLLKEWRAEALLPPHFQEAVWRRIEEKTPGTVSIWIAVRRWIETALPRPALAVSYVVLLLVVGATAGWTRAQDTNTHVKTQLGERYVQVLDPYRTPRN
jgi:hypothetical protein